MKRVTALMICLSLLLSSVLFVPLVTAEDNAEENVLYYNDFSDNADGMINNYYSIRYDTDFGIKTLATGEDVFYMTSAKESGSYQMASVSTQRYEKKSDRDLVFEYRVKVGSLQYYTWFGYNQMVPETARSGRYYHTAGFIFNESDKESVTKLSDSLGAWHTYTFVYSAKEDKRSAYLDGVYLGSSDDTELTTDSTAANTSTVANTWDGANGYFEHAFLFYCLHNATVQSEAYLDYVKIYEAPAQADVVLRNADKIRSQNLQIDFNSRVEATTLTKEQFTVNGAAVKSVQALDEFGQSYELILSSPLTGGETYTLGITGVKDVFGRTINKEIPFTALASFQNNIAPAYFLDFDSAADVARLKEYHTTSGGVLTEITSHLAVAEDTGETIYRVQDNRSGSGTVYTYLETPMVTNTDPDRPEIVFEFRIRAPGLSYDASNYNMLSSQGSQYFYTQPYASNWGRISGWGKANQMSPNGGLTYIPYDESEWHTLSFVYSNTGYTRDFYLDGEKIGEGYANNNSKYDNQWYDNGHLVHAFQLQNEGNASYKPFFELDYIRAYYPTDSFDVQLLNVTDRPMNELTLDFNSYIYDLTTDHILVNGKKPVSISVLDKNAQTYRVVLSETIHSGPDSIIQLTGVKDTLGNTLTKELIIEAIGDEEEAEPQHKVFFEIGEQGSVEVDGTAIANGGFVTVYDGEDVTFTVVPDDGCRLADAWVNDIPVIVNTDQNYTIRNVTKNTKVKLTYESNKSLPEIKVSNQTYLNAAENSSVSFATLINTNASYRLSTYGMIASKIVQNPTLSDVQNGLAFELKSETGVNARGQFGIKITDPEQKGLSGTYWVRPYAFYGTRLIYADEAVAVDFTGTLTDEITWKINEARLAEYENVHPRLFFTETGFDALKEKVKDTSSNEHRIWKIIQNESRIEEYYGDEIPVWEENNSGQNGWLNTLGWRLPMLALSYRLTEDEKYLEKGLEIIDACFAYPKWAGDSEGGDGDYAGLNSISIYEGIALFYDWCYHSLDPEKANEIAIGLGERGETLLGPQWYQYAYLQNHYSLNVSSIVIAASAIYDVYPNAKTWLDSAAEKFKLAFSFLPDDGAAYEGKEYHQWMYTYLVKSAILLEQICGINLFEYPLFENMIDFTLYNHYGMSYVYIWEGQFWFGDTSADNNEFGLAPAVAYLANRFDHPVGKWHMEQLLSKKYDYRLNEHDWMMLLYAASEYKGINPYSYPDGGYPLDRVFEETGYAYMRQHWAGREDALAFHCGAPLGSKMASYGQAPNSFYDPGAGHSHADNGHFQLYVNGEWLFGDDGYTTSSTKNHSTVLIDGIGQHYDKEAIEQLGFTWSSEFARQFVASEPKIVKMESYDDYCYMVADVTDAYHEAAGFAKFHRHYIYHRDKRTLIVFDDLATSKDSAVFNIRFRPTSQDGVQVNSKEYTFSSEKNELKIEVLNDADAITYQEEQLLSGKSGGRRAVNILQINQKGKECTNGTAISWTAAGQTPADVNMTQTGDVCVFTIDGNVTLTLNVKNQSVTMGN